MAVTIMYTNKHGKQYSEDFDFKTVSIAKDYLIANGYTEINRVFYREYDGGKSKAHIHILNDYEVNK